MLRSIMERTCCVPVLDVVYSKFRLLQGQQIGLLNMDISPCDKKGKEFTDSDDQFVEDPKQLIGRNLSYMVKIVSARGLPNKYTVSWISLHDHSKYYMLSCLVLHWVIFLQDIYAKYSFYNDKSPNCTKPVKDTSNPDWKFKKQHTVDSANEKVDRMRSFPLFIGTTK